MNAIRFTRRSRVAPLLHSGYGRSRLNSCTASERIAPYGGLLVPGGRIAPYADSSVALGQQAVLAR